MPYLAVFASQDRRSAYPSLVAISKRLEKKRLRGIEAQCKHLPTSLIGENHLGVAGDLADGGERLWLVLMDVDVQELSEARRAEVQSQLDRLLSLIERPVKPLEQQRTNGELIPDERLAAWASWFREVPAAQSLPPVPVFTSTEIEVGNWRTWAWIVLLLVTISTAAAVVAASGSPLLQFGFHIFRVVLVGLLVTTSLSLAFLADWIGQPRTLALCYSVTFLCWRVSASLPFHDPALVLDALLRAALLGAFAYGTALLAGRYNESVVPALLLNAGCGMVGVVLLIVLMSAGVIR